MISEADFKASIDKVGSRAQSRASVGTVRASLRKAFSFPVMLVGWLILVVVRLAEDRFPDPDIWFHIRNAQFLLANHRLPSFDSYSFTVAGKLWPDHEWLGEVPYYLAFKAFGLEGIEILMLALLVLISLGVLYLCYRRSRHIKASILACFIAAHLASVNAGPRTILFGYAYLVILLIILERFRTRGHAPLWLLPPLFCLWINCHGSWLLGLLVLAIFTASGMVEGEWGNLQATRWQPGQLRRLLATIAVSCAALFVNPYGYRLVFYPFDVAFRQSLTVAFVDEWASTNFHSLRGTVVMVVLAGLFISALTARRKWRLSDVALIVFAFYMGLSHERFLFLVGVVVAPTVAQLLEDFVPVYRPEIDKPWLNAAILAGVMAFVIFRFPSPAQLEEQISQEYPAEVLSYLESHPPSGRMLNFFGWGGYLGWKEPSIKVFIDTRVEIFIHNGVFQDYIRLATLDDSLRILDDYRIRYVLFPTHDALTYLLRNNPGWKVDYRGNLSTLIERVGTTPAGPSREAGMGNRLPP